MSPRGRLVRVMGVLLASACAVAGCSAPASEAPSIRPQVSTASRPVAAKLAPRAAGPGAIAEPARVLAVAPVPSSAQGSVVVVLEGGLTLRPPAGWTAQPGQGSKRVLVPPVDDSLVVASLDPGQASMATSELLSGIQLGNGVFLRPTGTPRQADGVHSNDFIVEGSPTGARAVVMIRDAGPRHVVSLIGLATPGRLELIRAAMAQMLASATFDAAAAEGAGGDLAAYLKGRYLVRFYSGNGYSEKHELWLCSNGQFRRRVDGGGFTQGVASGAFEGGGIGTWSAQGGRVAGMLLLSGADGSVRRLEVRETADSFLLDGEKWLRGENQLCK